MNQYADFFLSAPSSVILFDLIEVSHPSFETMRFCRNSTEIITVKHEDDTSSSYYYRPMTIGRSSVSTDLEQKVQVTISDLDNLIISNIDLAIDGVDFEIRPSVRYRIYREDDLNTPIYSLETLEITSISSDSSSWVTFEAKAPELNSVKTGQVYTMNRFPMLRGTL